MSPGNVDVIRRLYAAVSAGDASTASEFADPNLEWISDPRLGMGPIRGRDSVHEFFVDTASSFGELEVEVEELLEHGDRVLVFLRLSGSGAASGAAFEIRIAHLWTLRDGRVVRGEGYGNRDEALEAAGLRE
jgi:ketosteroid isomerase-like protein